MIHKQQLGHGLPEIIAGLCEAMVRNYLNNVGKGKEIEPPVVFQGGVAANVGIKAAFEKELGCKVHVPEYYDVMGAIGAGILAREYILENKRRPISRVLKSLILLSRPAVLNVTAVPIIVR